MPDPTGTNLTDSEVAYLDGRDHGFKRFSLASRIQAIREDIDAMGYDFKASVRIATTTTLALSGGACTYANGTAGVGATLTGNANGALAAIDGITLTVIGSRLLVKNQASGLENGIYVLTQVGTAGTPFILTRAEDCDSATELTSGFIVPIEEGTVNADSMWQLTTNAPITVGTTALVFSRESVDLASVAAALGITEAVAVASSAGAGDAGKIIKLDGAGLIDDSFIPLATEAAVGGRELSSQAEADAGTNDVTILTPLKHAAFAGTLTGIRTKKQHAGFAGSGTVEETAAVRTADGTETSLWTKALADDTAYWLEADIVAREITGAGTSENAYKIRCLASRRAAGAAALGVAGSVSLYVDEQDTDWAAFFDVSGNNVRLRVTGDAATTSLAWAGTIRWQAVSTVA